MTEWTNEEVWEVGEKVVIKYGDQIKEFDRQVTAEDIKAIAREFGLKKFTVHKDGETLSPTDFPIDPPAQIEIKEYNEAKNC